MKFLITVILAGGESLSARVQSETMGRAFGNLLASAEGVERIELHDARSGRIKLLVQWGTE